MKTFFLSLIFALTLQTTEQTAKVSPVQGVYIFYLSTPVAPYTTLGKFKVKQNFTGEPKEQVPTALKKALELYPTANGIIFTDLNMQQAEAIKL